MDKLYNLMLVDTIDKTLANSYVFFSLILILSNFGARYIHLDLSDKQHKMLSNWWLRRAYIFSIIYMGTRDLRLSLIITGIVTVGVIITK